MSKEPVSYDFEQKEYDLDPSKVMDIISRACNIYEMSKASS
jgi:hypothetical protein